jgi:hypothetical protein
MQSHGCALPTHTFASGRNQAGLSRLAARIAMNPGPAELEANSGVPQFGQNSRLAVLPLSATLS